MNVNECINVYLYTAHITYCLKAVYNSIECCVHDSGTALTVFLEAFAEKETNNFKMFLNHVTKQQQQQPQNKQ